MIDLLNRILNDPAGLTLTVFVCGALFGAGVCEAAHLWRELGWRRKMTWREDRDPCDERD